MLLAIILVAFQTTQALLEAEQPRVKFRPVSLQSIEQLDEIQHIGILHKGIGAATADRITSECPTSPVITRTCSSKHDSFSTQNAVDSVFGNDAQPNPSETMIDHDPHSQRYRVHGLDVELDCVIEPDNLENALTDRDHSLRSPNEFVDDGNPGPDLQEKVIAYCNHDQYFGNFVINTSIQEPNIPAISFVDRNPNPDTEVPSQEVLKQGQDQNEVVLQCIKNIIGKPQLCDTVGRTITDDTYSDRLSHLKSECCAAYEKSTIVDPELNDEVQRINNPARRMSEVEVVEMLSLGPSKNNEPTQDEPIIIPHSILSSTPDLDNEIKELKVTSGPDHVRLSSEFQGCSFESIENQDDKHTTEQISAKEPHVEHQAIPFENPQGITPIERFDYGDSSILDDSVQCSEDKITVNPTKANAQHSLNLNTRNSGPAKHFAIIIYVSSLVGLVLSVVGLYLYYLYRRRQRITRVFFQEPSGENIEDSLDRPFSTVVQMQSPGNMGTMKSKQGIFIF